MRSHRHDLDLPDLEAYGRRLDVGSFVAGTLHDVDESDDAARA